MARVVAKAVKRQVAALTAKARATNDDFGDEDEPSQEDK